LVLDSINCKEQSYFLQGRDTNDNTVIIKEVGMAHYYSSIRKKNQLFVFKLDMEREFDRVVFYCGF